MAKAHKVNDETLGDAVTTATATLIVDVDTNGSGSGSGSGSDSGSDSDSSGQNIPFSSRKPLIIGLVALLTVLLVGVAVVIAYCFSDKSETDIRVPDVRESAGEETVRIPDVVGINQADAEVALTTAGFQVTYQIDEFSDIVPAGHVISQTPFGQGVRGDIITLKLSRGSKNYQSSGNISLETTRMADSVALDTPFISQLSAGAPMGCEAASLLQALRTKGYATDLDLATLLRQMPIAEDDNPNHGFSTTPYEVLSDYYYQSIFAAPLAAWGVQYGNVVDISGASLDQLKQELLNGNPIVVYVTIDFQTPVWQNWWFGPAVNNAHIMTLAGFDEPSGQVYIVDPYRGYCWIDQDIFYNCYSATGGAVVVR